MGEQAGVALVVKALRIYLRHNEKEICPCRGCEDVTNAILAFPSPSSMVALGSLAPSNVGTTSEET